MQAAIQLLKWARWALHLHSYTCPGSRVHSTIPTPHLKLSWEHVPEISLLGEVRVMREQKERTKVGVEGLKNDLDSFL